MEAVLKMEQDIKPQTTHVKPMCARCKEICKEGQQAILDYFKIKVIVGTKEVTAYSFKEPTMPKKARRPSSLDSSSSSTLLLFVASDTSCESGI